jgi:hypothetical protein
VPRGSRPGERRGGRQPGTPNKATASVRALAQEHTPEALEKLVHLMRHAESEAAQIAAIRELLDRAHGRPTQPLAGEDGGPVAIPAIRVEFVSPGAGAGEGGIELTDACRQSP